MKRTYNKACEWCGATGRVPAGYLWGTAAPIDETCPVCNGSKVVLVTETEDSPETGYDIKYHIDGDQLVGILKNK